MNIFHRAGCMRFVAGAWALLVMPLSCFAESPVPRLIIHDTFRGTANASASGRSPDTANLPGSAWTVAAFNTGGGFATRLIPATDAMPPGIQLVCGGNSNGALVVSIADAGSYAKPTRMTISADLRGSSPALGFYSTMPVADPDGVFDVWAHFTGLQLDSHGSLILYQNGAIVRTIAFTGSFNPDVFHKLSYDIDTQTGTITNVRLQGSASDYIAFHDVDGFTDQATAYAAIACLAYNSRDNIAFASDFQLTANSDIPSRTVPPKKTNQRTSSPILVHTGDKIGFMGDSITAQGAAPFGYISLTIAGLNQAGVQATAIPAGINGHTSGNMVGRLHHDILHQGANWMTLSCGVNDVAHQPRGFGVDLEHYQRNVSRMVQMAQGWQVKVVLLTATPLGEDLASENNAKINQYNDFLRAFAREHHLVLADVNAAFAKVLKSPLGPGETAGKRLLADGIHPNREGQFLMAKVVLEALGVPRDQMPRIENALRENLKKQ